VAKPNYSFEKKQREMAQKKKQDEKRQKKHQTRQRVAYDVNRGEAHRHLL